MMWYFISFSSLKKKLDLEKQKFQVQINGFDKPSDMKVKWKYRLLQIFEQPSTLIWLSTKLTDCSHSIDINKHYGVKTLIKSNLNKWTQWTTKRGENKSVIRTEDQSQSKYPILH